MEREECIDLNYNNHYNYTRPIHEICDQCIIDFVLCMYVTHSKGHKRIQGYYGILRMS